MNVLPKNKKIIVFDGVCLLCNNYVKFIARNDSKDYFRFISIKNKKILKLITANDIRIGNESILLINNDDSIRKKSSAVVYILSKLNFPYRLFSVLSIFPTKLLDYFYDFIAKRRYQIFGKVEHCSIIYSSKTPNIKNKLIE